VQRVERDHEVELVSEGHRLGGPHLEAEAGRRRRDGDHPGRRVDTHAVPPRNPFGERLGHPAVATADVEEAVDAVQVDVVERPAGQPLLQRVHAPVACAVPVGQSATG
jgi:hypothetical protein